MGEQLGLTELLTAERFARIERVFRRHFQLGLETTDPDGQRVESLCSSDCEGDFCRLVRSGQEGHDRCIAEHRRAVEIAAETGQSFITICHAGIVLVCVPVVDGR
jgi:ligand-binding sensor protein